MLIIVHHLILKITKILILREGPTFGINGSFGSTDKKFIINFSNANTKFCLSLHYNADNSISLTMEKKYLNSAFQLNFVFEVYLMDFVLLSLEKYL